MTTNTQHNPTGADNRTISELQRLSSVARDTAQITAEVPAWLQSELVTMADAMADAAGEISRLQALADSGGRTISEQNAAVIPEVAIESAFRAYLASTGRASTIPAALMREMLAAATPHMAPFQDQVKPWMLECFGEEIAGDTSERNHRFLEESLELVQSCGCSQDDAHQLVDYVFGRPPGDPVQEAGGVMVTLAALCLAQGMDMHAAGETELARIWTKVEQIRLKQATKPKHGPTPA